MLPPVTIDEARPFDLASLGHPAPIVLTPARPLSPPLRYRIPEDMSGKLRVVLRATVETSGPPHGSFDGSLGAEQDGHLSAAVFVRTVRSKGRWKIRWTEGGVKDRGGVTDARRFRVRAEQLSRAQGDSPGVHALRFELERVRGMRIRRVVIDPSSGLRRHRQPVLPLTVTVDAIEPAAPAAGQPFVVRVTLRNVGVLPSGPVRFGPAIPDDGPRPDGAYPVVPSIPPGGSAPVELRLFADEAGPPQFQLDLRSRVGGNVLDVGFTQDLVPPPA